MEWIGKRNKSRHLGFLLHDTIHHCRGLLQNVKILALIAAEKSVAMRKKENWTNKGNDKHEDTHSLSHNTRSQSNVCTNFQNPRSYSS